MIVINFDVKLIKSKEGIHRFLKKRIKSDDYIGNNLDALYDVLSTFDESIKFNISNLVYVNMELESYVFNLINTLKDVSEINDNITVEIINEVYIL